MIMQTRIFLAAVVLFLFVGCTGEGGDRLTLIEGRIVHPDGTPAANTPIVAGIDNWRFEQGLADLLWTGSYDIIYTDSQGRYQYSYISQEGNVTILQPYGAVAIDTIHSFTSCRVDKATLTEGARNVLDFKILPNPNLRIDLNSFPNADSIHIHFERSDCRTFQDFQALLGPQHTAPYVVSIWPHGTYNYVLQIFTSPLSMTEKRGTFTVADEPEFVLSF